jgi:type I restriction enzyme S subunit
MSQQVIYKETNHFWFPSIPSNWDIIKLKWLAKIYSGGTPDKNRQEYWTDGTIPWLNSGSVNQYIITEPSAFITEEGLQKSSAKWIKKNSILIALAGQGKTKGMSAILDFEATCNQSLGVISPLENRIYSKYLLYFLTNNYYNIRGIAGESRDGLNLETIGDIKIHLPSVKTQTVISNFLDQKTQEIDNLISKKQKLVECLKEEKKVIINNAVTKGINSNTQFIESGITWLGKVPKHWKVKKLGREIFIQEGPGIMANDFRSEGIPLIRISGMKDDHVSLEGCNFLDEEMVDLKWKHFKLELNDLLISCSASTDLIAEVNDNTIVGAIPYTGLVRIKPYSNLNREFLKYFIKSYTYQQQVEVLKAGSTIQHYGPTHLKTFFIIIPPVDEQIIIAKYIDKRNKRINFLISKIEKEIDLIKEYRTSLINEVVTGKITLN